METEELIAALGSWAPLVAEGYEVPAAGQVMFEAARRLLELEEELESVREELQICQFYSIEGR